MKTAVIKVGGAFLDSPDIAQKLFNTLAKVTEKVDVILVHGGGSTVERLFVELGLKSHKIDGLRVTPKAHIDYVVGALAGTVNTQLCSLANVTGLKSVGLNLLDGGMTIGQPIKQELGHVGSVEMANTQLIDGLLQSKFLPIISSIGADASGNLLNINADQAAMALAQGLDAELLLLSDVPGVLDEHKNMLSKLSKQDIDRLIERGVIKDGMAVKVNAALAAAEQIGHDVTIASWRDVEALGQHLLGFNNTHFGTKITPNAIGN